MLSRPYGLSWQGCRAAGVCDTPAVLSVDADEGDADGVDDRPLRPPSLLPLPLLVLMLLRSSRCAQPGPRCVCASLTHDGGRGSVAIGGGRVASRRVRNDPRSVPVEGSLGLVRGPRLLLLLLLLLPLLTRPLLLRLLSRLMQFRLRRRLGLRGSEAVASPAAVGLGSS
mmetsp:Transcript_3749/g.10597  ORF Transcript_3749/g.10597 Transcript_3749/m.10597 type:complete len:169 (-) Transcript_3749:3327-3833(-)